MITEERLSVIGQDTDRLIPLVQSALPDARLAAWQFAPEYRAMAERNLNAALCQVAQICAMYRLTPGEDITIIPIGNSFAVNIGYATWTMIADRHCARIGATWQANLTDMQPGELAAIRGRNVDPGDVGKVAHLLRSDKAQVYQMFGKEAATRGTGIWQERAYQQKDGSWKSDPLFGNETPADVAGRRAIKMALMKEFSLDTLLLSSGQGQSIRSRLMTKLESNARDRAMLVDRPRYTEDEDGMLWA